MTAVALAPEASSYAAPATKSEAKSAAVDPPRIEAIDAWAAGLVADKKLAGIQIIVAHDGTQVHFSNAGFQDLEHKTPITPQTLFRIYSLTKAVTSVAVMILVDEGRLSLDESVASYLPQFGKVKVYKSGTAEDMQLDDLERPITIFDLLTHTAGLTFGSLSDTPVDTLYREHNVFDPAHDLAQRVDAIASMPLLYQPGEQWHYSPAPEILGRVIEIVSGESFEGFLDSRIFAPLGMRDTGFQLSKAATARLGPLYISNPAEGLKLLDSDWDQREKYSPKNRMRSGANGLLSTGPDMMRFLQMLMQGGSLDGIRILKAETVELMTTNRLRPDQIPDLPGAEGLGFGLGFSIVTESDDSPYRVGEYSWGGVAGTRFFSNPGKNLVALYMSQTLGRGSSNIRADFIPLIYHVLGLDDARE